MENCVEMINVVTNDSSKIKDRAAKLADYVNQNKKNGIVIDPHEPIEGKMFWR